MMKSIVPFGISVLISLMLCGCGAEADEMQSSSVSEKETLSDSLETTDIPAIAEAEWRDNSLDIYSAVINVPLRVEEPEDALEGGSKGLFLGNSTAFYFKKHYFDPLDKSWDELSVVNVQGEESSVKWSRDNEVACAGEVFGTDHYMVQTTESVDNGDAEPAYEYRFTEMDENGNAVRETCVSFLEEFGFVSQIRADKSGRIHFTFETVENSLISDEWHYYIVSPEGELLQDYSAAGSDLPRLVSLYDGRVAFWMNEMSAELQYIDAESGETVTLAALENVIFNDYAYTLSDENTLLYGNERGIYRSDLKGDNPEPLYLWENHGIIAHGVGAMQALEGGGIALIYESEEGMNYLYLKPTTEEVEIREITLAVPSYRKSVYANAVTEFNRKYPTYHIKLKGDYSYMDTSLLTTLTAGEGPVLVDTSLTGFENQEKLWEPLDTVLEQSGILGELRESVMENGKINGTYYGVITDFSLETVVTANQELQDWDYEAFLREITENPDLEAIINSYAGDDGWYFITNFFIHSLEDNYLLDIESGTTNFDSEEFRKILEAAKTYCVRDDWVEPGGLLFEGKVLCNTVQINKPEQIALCRIYYGEDINYIGYPSEDGASHYISFSYPLAIRKTADKEEKEIAAAFINLLLSYECQLEAAKDENFGLSIRKDVLEAQINSMNEQTCPTLYGFEQIQLGENLNIELDAETLYRLLEEARPKKAIPQELVNILTEETESYFSGEITEDMAIEHLENRVGLYLSEQQ